MSVLDQVVEGWTALLGPYTIRLNGLPYDLTGYTVSLILHNAAGQEVIAGGSLIIDPDQLTNKGKVTYAPVADDFQLVSYRYTFVQNYQVHFRLVDSLGKVAFAPNGEGYVIEVARA